MEAMPTRSGAPGSREIKGHFFVPAYQRGYRWGEVEVTNLLDDISMSNYGKPYYLQPIVVKKHGDEWELIDGQQRLTTLFLIFQYMKHEKLQRRGAKYSLRYETREGSAGYLEAPDPEGSQREHRLLPHLHGLQLHQGVVRGVRRAPRVRGQRVLRSAASSTSRSSGTRPRTTSTGTRSSGVSTWAASR